MRKPKFRGYRIIVLLLVPFFLINCSREIDPVAIVEISDIIISDHSNNDNGSDIEVNFTKQISTSQIKEYRIFTIKATLSLDFGMEEAIALAPEFYTAVNPEDIYPVQGKTLTADTKDIDGDIINSATAYIFGILSVSNDPKQFTNSFSKSTDEFELTNNNIITNYTQDFSGGASSLALNNHGKIYMGHFEIIAVLVNSTNSIYPIYEIDVSGNVSEYLSPFKLLSGNAIDSEQNLYQSVLFSDQILKIDQNGEIEEVIVASVREPDGIYIDASDNMFVVGRASGTVIKFMPDGTSTYFANVGANPRGITGDESGNLYVIHNREDGRITKISSAGMVSTLANIPTYIPDFYQVEYIMWAGYIVYHDGFLYVAGTSTDKIYKVSLEGEVEVFAGSGTRGVPRGGALTANLNRPMGLVFSEDGNSLFISGSADNVPQHTQSSIPSKLWEIKIAE